MGQGLQRPNLNTKADTINVKVKQRKTIQS